MMRRMLVTLPVLLMAMPMTGCMQKMSVEEFSQMMPPRPAEMDRLEAFIGTWKGDGTMTSPMVEGPMSTTGQATARWAGDDKSVLVNIGTFSMAGSDQAMTGIETWTYDAEKGVYRFTWTDSFGATGTGTGRYCEDTGTWTMKGKSKGPMGSTTTKGTARFVDKDTMEWTFTEYAMGGLMKTMEMMGTSKRQ